MNHLDSFVRDWVSPVMKEAGYRKSGNLFRRTSDDGSSAFLQFSSYRIDENATVFEVEFFIVPISYWKWLNRDLESLPKMNGAGAFVSERVFPPDELAHTVDGAVRFRYRWAFSTDATRAACGSELVSRLRDSVLPKLEALLDGPALLAEVAHPTPPMILLVEREMAEILLRIDDAPDGYIEERIQRLKNLDHMRGFVSWVSVRPGS